MAEEKQPIGGLHFVGRKDELTEAKRSCRTLAGRDVLIIFHQGGFYAIDSYCYREFRGGGGSSPLLSLIHQTVSAASPLSRAVQSAKG